MKKVVSAAFFIFTCFTMNAQELPYRQIPDYPSEYTSGNIVSRMVEGLGYRYYWATEGLRQQDLDYRPSEEGRTVLETLQHIYGMSEMILNTPSATPNVRPKDFSGHSFEALRKMKLLITQETRRQGAQGNIKLAHLYSLIPVISLICMIEPLGSSPVPNILKE